MDEIVQEFVTEASESLAILDQQLVTFEKDPSDKAILGNIFRLLHTIKGTCGFIGLARLETLAHAGEDVLGRYRDNSLKVSTRGVSLVLRCIDTIRSLINELSASGAEPAGNDEELISQLRGLLDGDEGQHESALATPGFVSGAHAVLADEGFPIATELLEEIQKAMHAQERADKDIAPAQATPVVPVAAAATVDSPERPSPTLPRVDTNAELQKPVAMSSAQPIRVSVEVLESLMTLVSELVLTRNQILQISRTDTTQVYRDPIQRLSRITGDLQEGVMKTRMQPVGNAWTKLPRIIRDLANEMGKKINLVMEGESTEMDRQVLELIKDPLTHMVRNSADHGLETPEERKQAGKSEQGTIRLTAFHEGGHIVIRIVDDGRGLNTSRIREKIVEKELALTDEVKAMSDDEVHQYILKPGFSTAAKITNVSGRGVGMDVVKTNVEKIGGTIEFKSRQGEGTSFSLKIPLTLAIVPALIISCASQHYAIPQANIQEVVRANGRAQQEIETINNAPVLRLRDRLLPLVTLDALLGLRPLAEAYDTSRRCFVVVVQNRGRQFGIVADGIDDSEEIVVKPVPTQFREVSIFSGITIMGDGSLVLILDLNALDAQLSLTSNETADEPNSLVRGQPRQRILLFQAAGRGQKGVPLKDVERIEALRASELEFVQGSTVLQYRGGLMRVLDLNGDSLHLDKERQPMLVFGTGDQAIGLGIDSIVDVVDEVVDLVVDGRQEWASGSAILGGKATDLINPAFYLPRALGAAPTAKSYLQAAE
jgi:two-component system, chemotaxis family, sensor kinase CheA